MEFKKETTQNIRFIVGVGAMAIETKYIFVTGSTDTWLKCNLENGMPCKKEKPLLLVKSELVFQAQSIAGMLATMPVTDQEKIAYAEENHPVCKQKITLQAQLVAVNADLAKMK